MPTEVYVGLGSNLGYRGVNLLEATHELRRISTSIRMSSIYETSPQGFQGQPLFLNAVCQLSTELDPFQILRKLQEIENDAGRERSFPNAPRILDLDLLIYGRLVLRSPHLTLPHPEIAQRAFVIQPLAEIVPGLLHPILKESMRSLLTRLHPLERGTVCRIGHGGFDVTGEKPSGR